MTDEPKKTMTAADMARRRWELEDPDEAAKVRKIAGQKGGKAVWEAFPTPEERSAEMRRRAARRKKRVGKHSP